MFKLNKGNERTFSKKKKKIHRSPVNTNVKDNYGGIHFTLTMEFSLKK